MIIIDDENVCPQCGGYWTNTGHCTNGHPKPVIHVWPESQICTGCPNGTLLNSEADLEKYGMSAYQCKVGAQHNGEDCSKRPEVEQ